MARTFIYVVDRDFGFAPNPFHGMCTLATCKPRIRSTATLGDWVVGVGGQRLRATGRCIFAMRVDEKLSFDTYWERGDFECKKPRRNGSLTMLVGDNIYHRDGPSWIQEDSHHSKPDGSPNPLNVRADTGVDAVLVSRHFYYFGESSPEIPLSIFQELRYQNGRNHRTFSLAQTQGLLIWLSSFNPNYLYGDPVDFGIASERYSGQGSRLSREHQR